ncbi:MAG: hypothetical protein GX636_02880 [Actinomycetales bacterium]|nr:hypothetical protein [Actinomycetales bacterium]
MNKLITAFLVLIAAVVSSTAGLVVVANGSLYAGATNEAVGVESMQLAAPAYFDSVSFWVTGTNAATVALSGYDAGLEKALVPATEIAGGTGLNVVAPGRTNDMLRVALSSLRLTVTKVAGPTNGAPTSVFYRVYGDTE